MNAKRVSMIFIVLVLLFTAIAPMPVAAAPSTNSNLVIKNKTPGPVTITLTGPKTYTITAAVGATNKEIIKGKYAYIYKACGQTKKGNLDANSGKSKLNITPCQMAKVAFVNLSSTTLTLSLAGPQTLTVVVPPQNYKIVSVYRGEYQTRATWCNQTRTITMNLTGTKKWYFWGC